MIISLKIFYKGKWKKVKNIKDIKDCEKVHIVESLTRQEFEKKYDINLSNSESKLPSENSKADQRKKTS